MKKVKNEIRLLNLLRIVRAVITILFFAAMAACTQPGNSTFTVDVSKPGSEVAPICRGQQLEEFNHQFEGGLYAQLINNPSFEELKNPISNRVLVKSGSSNASLFSQTSTETSMLNSNQEHCIYYFPAYSVSVLRIGLIK